MITDLTNFSLRIPSEILWGVFALFLIIFLIISVMLNHHWGYHGIKDNPKVYVKTLHWSVSLVLIFIMMIALLIYEVN